MFGISKPVKFVILIVGLLTIACMPIALEGCQFTNLSSFPSKTESHPKMDFALNQLVHISETKGVAEAIAFAQQSSMKLEDNKVKVIIETGMPGCTAKTIGTTKSNSGKNLAIVRT